MTNRPALPLLADGFPPEPGVLAQWLAGLSKDVTEVVIDPVPAISAHLPACLAAAGITHVVTSARAQNVRWYAPTGAAVAVNAATDTGKPWRGDLPDASLASTADDPARSHETRLRQAAAATAVWPDGRMPAPVAGTLVAWNPSPLARRAIVAFPALKTPAEGRAPWGLRDPTTGARHPLQVIEGALGPEWLASLPLEAMEVATFLPELDPVDGGAPWDVSEEILDNGLVRVEFDLYGNIGRLCFGGRFVPIAAPLLRAGQGDALLTASPARCTVLETGPVRARLAITRELPGCVLHLIFTLHAFDPCLRVSVAWDGELHGRWLDVSTAIGGQPWQRSVGWMPDRIHDDGTRWHHGLAWARLDDGDGGGLTVTGSRPWNARSNGSALFVAAQAGLTLTLSDPRLSDPSTTAERWVTPALAVGPTPGQQPFRLVMPAGVSPLWLRRSQDGIWSLTLAEQRGRAARGWLFPRPSDRAWLTDLRGRPHRACAQTPEQDGFQIDLAAGAIHILHWRETTPKSAAT